MLFKVELHPDVTWYIRHRCRRSVQDDFYRQLQAIRSEPINNSEAIDDPRLSRYLLRFFRFAGDLAIFELDLARSRIRVLECRALPHKRKPGGGRLGPSGSETPRDL